MKYILILFCSLLLISSCKKDNSANKPQGKYTVQGKVLIDTFLQPYSKVPVELYVTRGAQSTFISKTLGTATTNDSGWFSITYDATDVTGDDGGGANPAQVHLSSQWFIYDNLPVNANVNKTFVRPVKGSLQIYLQTSNPLETNHDTLYFGFYQDKTGVTNYAITNTVNGLYKTFTVQLDGFTVYYGRGRKAFGYDSKSGRFLQGTKYVDAIIHGDPVVDKITINY